MQLPIDKLEALDLLEAFEIAEWKPVVGYEGCYEVSNTGLVRSLDRVRPLISRSGNLTVKRFYGNVMKTNLNNKGYVMCYLCMNSKRKAATVHRLVALAHIPNPENLPEVNHKDGNKLNNCVTNLEWSSVADNRKHAYDTGLQPKKVFKNEARANKHS